MKRILLIAIAGLILTGCAAVPTYDDFVTQPQRLYPSPSAGKALIYFYKETSFEGALFYIRQGDKIIGAAGPEGYFFREFDPGEQCFWAEITDGLWGDVKKFFCQKTDAGRTYYIALSGEPMGIGTTYAHPSFQAVPEGFGRDAVRKLSYIKLKIPNQ
jgi:hypothetical protein